MKTKKKDKNGQTLDKQFPENAITGQFRTMLLHSKGVSKDFCPDKLRPSFQTKPPDKPPDKPSFPTTSPSLGSAEAHCNIQTQILCMLTNLQRQGSDSFFTMELHVFTLELRFFTTELGTIGGGKEMPLGHPGQTS